MVKPTNWSAENAVWNKANGPVPEKLPVGLIFDCMQRDGVNEMNNEWFCAKCGKPSSQYGHWSVKENRWMCESNVRQAVDKPQSVENPAVDFSNPPLLQPAAPILWSALREQEVEIKQLKANLLQMQNAGIELTAELEFNKGLSRQRASDALKLQWELETARGLLEKITKTATMYAQGTHDFWGPIREAEAFLARTNVGTSAHAVTGTTAVPVGVAGTDGLGNKLPGTAQPEPVFGPAKKSMPTYKELTEFTNKIISYAAREETRKIIERERVANESELQRQLDIPGEGGLMLSGGYLLHNCFVGGVSEGYEACVDIVCVGANDSFLRCRRCGMRVRIPKDVPHHEDDAWPHLVRHFTGCVKVKIVP